MSVLIDIPWVAYKTWVLEYRIYDKDGKKKSYTRVWSRTRFGEDIIWI